MNSIAIQTFDKLGFPVYVELASFDEVGVLSLSKEVAAIDGLKCQFYSISACVKVTLIRPSFNST